MCPSWVARLLIENIAYSCDMLQSRTYYIGIIDFETLECLVLLGERRKHWE
jgi:hypothetical protein